jgi:hypothetical protein
MCAEAMEVSRLEENHLALIRENHNSLIVFTVSSIPSVVEKWQYAHQDG